MASKPAIIVYYNVMSPQTYQFIEICKSGKEACEHIKLHAKEFFEMPVRYKNKLHITKNSSVSIGFGFRALQARFLDNDEIKIYQEYGDHSFFSPTEGRLVEPNDETKEKHSPTN